MEKYGLTYTQKIELSELLIYAFDPAKDFKHNLKNRVLDFDIKSILRKNMTCLLIWHR